MNASAGNRSRLGESASKIGKIGEGISATLIISHINDPCGRAVNLLDYEPRGRGFELHRAHINSLFFLFMCHFTYIQYKKYFLSSLTFFHMNITTVWLFVLNTLKQYCYSFCPSSLPATSTVSLSWIGWYDNGSFIAVWIGYKIF